MQRFQAPVKRVFATTIRPSPPIAPIPTHKLINNPKPHLTTNFQAAMRAHSGFRRLDKLIEQGPFGDGFMDVGCKVLKTVLALVMVNVVVWHFSKEDGEVEAKDADEGQDKDEGKEADAQMGKMAVKP